MVIKIKIFDSELEIMKILWDYDTILIKEVASKLSKKNGWTPNTTYTLINRLEKKGALTKTGTSARKLSCSAIITRSQVQSMELNEIVNKIFDGSTKNVFSTLVDTQPLPDEVLKKIKKIITEME